jgi:CheY-like chemotaxis protein
MAKILYVDADPARVAAVCALLGQNGHVVTAAGSAERAMLHVDREGGFEVVVAHLILPSIDGAELCRWLQRWSSLSGVPRIVFTSPGVHLRLNLQDGLPRWLPADVYIHGLEDIHNLAEAVEWVLHRRSGDA